MWEFLLWVRDVEKVVPEGNVTNFVHTYQLKTKTSRVGLLTVDFSTTKLAQAFALPVGGPDLGALPDLKKTEAEEIFDYKFRWGEDTKWIFGSARHHWKAWFEFVNTYLLFRPAESTMHQTYVVAAIRTWEGIEVNWAKVVQQQINEEIQIRKALNPSAICLYSAFYISCLCDPTSRKAAVSPPRGLAIGVPDSPGSPTEEEIELQWARRRIMDLEKQLMDKHVRIEQVQEKNAEYMLQVNKFLHEKFNDHRRIEELLIQNAALNTRISELQESCGRIQIDEEVRTPRPTTVNRSSNADDISTGPSTMVVLNQPVIETTRVLSAEVCKKLWEVESKISVGLNLHQLYEI